jgi:hypothetical protein
MPKWRASQVWPERSPGKVVSEEGDVEAEATEDATEDGQDWTGG